MTRIGRLGGEQSGSRPRMNVPFASRDPCRRAALAALFTLLAAVPAAADCKADLSSTQQSLERTRTALQQAASGPETQKCAAFRGHHTMMVRARGVFARCDTGPQTAE